LMLFSRSLARHTSTNVPLNLNPALHLTARTSPSGGGRFGYPLQRVLGRYLHGLGMACHVPSHDGFTCAERRIMADPDECLFHLWKIENAVKTCPSCRTPVQKADGCNHMTCAGCNAHWCWECSGIYPRDEIYGHMRQAHGGIGL
jgi:LSD1 subclass zinc finger protein